MKGLGFQVQLHYSFSRLTIQSNDQMTFFFAVGRKERKVFLPYRAEPHTYTLTAGWWITAQQAHLLSTRRSRELLFSILCDSTNLLHLFTSLFTYLFVSFNGKNLTLLFPFLFFFLWAYVEMKRETLDSMFHQLKKVCHKRNNEAFFSGFLYSDGEIHSSMEPLTLWFQWTFLQLLDFHKRLLSPQRFSAEWKTCHWGTLEAATTTLHSPHRFIV